MNQPQISGYTAADRERAYPEPPKHSWRGDFARDRARVVHSSALRRLSAKTQVVGPGTDDFVRNRLTHSLEVAQVGRELGAQLGCDPDVVETACLAHDLGHPPFGHNGEQALDQLALDIGGFEANAQTLRLLTRLEPKFYDPRSGRSHGLNLTRASLDAATKYPWRAGEAPIRTTKFGVYDDDLEVFSWLRQGAPQQRRCLEAQVMDLADDIAYSVHDVEDAIVSGRLVPGELGAREQLDRVVQQAQDWYLPGVGGDDIAAALGRLRKLPAWVHDFDGSYRGLAALKNMTSQLIGRFVKAAEEATRQRYSPGSAEARLTRYQADVVIPVETGYEIGTLKGLAAVYVMTIEERRPVYERQRALLAELVEEMAKTAPGSLDPLFAAIWAGAPGDAAKLRVVIDQVANLTDARAVALHGALTSRSTGGRSIPPGPTRWPAS